MFAVNDSELSSKRKELDEKLKKETQYCAFEQTPHCEDVLMTQIPSEIADEQSTSFEPKQFWYEIDLELFQNEKAAMAESFPHFQLDKLDDGRLCWVGSLSPLGDDGKTWTVMVVYENNHDGTTKKDGVDVSVKVYSIEPDLDDIISCQSAVFYDFSDILSDILQDAQGNYYICQFNMAENVAMTAAGSLMWATRHMKEIEKVFRFNENSDDTNSEMIKTKEMFLKKPNHVVFSNRAFTALLAETKEKFTTETGGIFLGIMCDDAWYVVEAIDPGPKSIFQTAYFEYDGDYVRHLANKVNRLYGDRLDVLGLWHRHPGSMDTFSNTDYETIKKFAAQNNGVTISALVNIDPKFRLTMYAAVLNDSLVYEKTTYEVDDNKVPKEVINVIYHKEFEERINSMTSRQKTSRQSKKNNFLNILLEYLKKADSHKITNGIIIENTDETRDLLIENYLADECIFCEEKAIPFICDVKEGNKIDFVIGEENSDLILSFCIFDFPRKGGFAIEKMLRKVFSSPLELQKKNEEQPCFIYGNKIYPYKG